MRTIDELKVKIIRTIKVIEPSTLKNVLMNMKKRTGACRGENGGHFEHML